jgi:hypothetical protein
MAKLVSSIPSQTNSDHTSLQMWKHPMGTIIAFCVLAFGVTTIQLGAHSAYADSGKCWRAKDGSTVCEGKDSHGRRAGFDQ